MHNQHVNDVRRSVRCGEEITIDSDRALSLPATTDPTGSRQLAELDRALGQLPEEQRQVIVLIGLEGMSYEDAATICAVPVGTVRSRLSRGRASLRQLMGTEEVAPAAMAAPSARQQQPHVAAA